MRPGPSYLVPAAIAALLAIGALQGRHIDHLRESEALYRWVFATATNIRLFEGDDEEYRDRELFDRINAQAPGDLIAMVSDGEQDWEIWNLVRGRELDGERAAFLEHVRNRELLFAQGIDVIEAQASGVNLFNLFIGFRKVAANFLWLQVDRYWHAGMMFRMIPLMRTCVTLDPQFIDAYLLGAWHLAYNATARMGETPPAEKEWHPVHQVCVGQKERYYYEAVDFLRHGIRNNPRNYKLYFDLGYAVYRNKLEDYENAVRYLSEAVRHPHERWVPRQLYGALELNGQYREALAGWEEYLEQFPDHEVAQRFILRNRGLILEEEAARLLEAGDEEGAAERMRRAREVWEEMYDPYADGRILIMDARSLAREGRYIEAIALLENARQAVSSLFMEASDLIIEYKQLAGIPLSVSEQKALLRDELQAPCQGQPPETFGT